MTKQTDETKLREELGQRVQQMSPDGFWFVAVRCFDELPTILAALSRPSDDAVVDAARAFVAKLDECQPYIDTAFFQMANHGMPHTGPRYGEELEALRQALARRPSASASASDDAVVGHVAAILEAWDMRPPPDETCGHSYTDIARDVVAQCFRRPSASAEPSGVGESGGAFDKRIRELTRESIEDSLAEIARAFDALFSDREEWREQHENLVGVRQVDLADELAHALWEESKFPSGGARTSLMTCKRIVNSAIARVANRQRVDG